MKLQIVPDDGMPENPPLSKGMKMPETQYLSNVINFAKQT
jgi:hypothetical protein